MQSEIDVLVVERPACVGANAAAVLRAVEGLRRAWPRKASAARAGKILLAGKNPVAEAAVHSEHLVVSKARLKGKLRDDVGRGVERIVGNIGSGGCGGGSGGGIVQAAAGPHGADQKIVGIPMRGHRSLGIFHRYREPHLIVETLTQTQSVLPCP